MSTLSLHAVEHRRKRKRTIRVFLPVGNNTYERELRNFDLPDETAMIRITSEGDHVDRYYGNLRFQQLRKDVCERLAYASYDIFLVRTANDVPAS